MGWLGGGEDRNGITSRGEGRGADRFEGKVVFYGFDTVVFGTFDTTRPTSNHRKTSRTHTYLRPLPGGENTI